VITATGNFRTNSVEALRMAALCGHGVALLPAVIIADDLRAGNLIQLLLEFRTNEVIIQAVYPPSRHLSAKARNFIDFLASRLRVGELASRLRQGIPTGYHALWPRPGLLDGRNRRLCVSSVRWTRPGAPARNELAGEPDDEAVSGASYRCRDNHTHSLSPGLLFSRHKPIRQRPHEAHDRILFCVR
jgi:hypothetical protein